MMADYVSKHTGAVIDSTIDRVLNGEAGIVQGVGIAAVYKRVSGIGNGAPNTILVELTDGSTYTFSVDNGRIPNFGTENAGKLMYIDATGEPNILTLGAGLQIAEGVLSVIGGSSGDGDDGGGDSGGDSGGEDPGDSDAVVEMTVDDDGNATVAGATLAVSDGDGSLSGATLTVDDNGDATIA